MNAQEHLRWNAWPDSFETVAAPTPRPPSLRARPVRLDRLAAHRSLAGLPTTQMSSVSMNTAMKSPNSGPLEKGQLWKVDENYLQIVDLGKRLIHYKLMKKPDQKAVITRMIGVEALAVYLRSNEATLVAQPRVVC